MSAKKVGTLIKKARTDAGFTQAGLADRIPGLSASELGKAERGEKALTTDQLKMIAKATGVTQKSLLEAAGPSSASTAKAKAKKPTSSSAPRLTANEKKLVELYRAADGNTKKMVFSILKGNAPEPIDMIGSLLGDTITSILK